MVIVSIQSYDCFSKLLWQQKLNDLSCFHFVYHRLAAPKTSRASKQAMIIKVNWCTVCSVGGRQGFEKTDFIHLTEMSFHFNHNVRNHTCKCELSHIKISSWTFRDNSVLVDGFITKSAVCWMSVPILVRIILLSGVCQLSVLLVNVLEVFSSPLCSSWATLYLWIYVIKHYITAVKEIVDHTVSFFFFITFPVARTIEILNVGSVYCIWPLVILLLSLGCVWFKFTSLHSPATECSFWFLVIFLYFLIHLWRFNYSCPVCIVALFTFHLLVPRVIKADCLPPCFLFFFCFCFFRLILQQLPLCLRMFVAWWLLCPLTARISCLYCVWI